MRPFFLLLFLFRIYSPLYGQTLQGLDDPEQLIERLFQNQSEDINYEDFYDILIQYYSEPLDLNTAEFSELMSIYLLTPREAQGIINYRTLTGKFLSVYELQAVPELPLDKIRQMVPFITVSSSLSSWESIKKSIKNNPNQVLIYRQTSRYPMTTKSYAGNNWQQFARYRSSTKGLYSFGFTMEKDAGEKLDWNHDTKGADFYSAHIQIQNLGKFENIILGDFQPHYGQGLVFGGGWGAGKGAETITGLLQTRNGVRPYTSVVESGFFRGFTVTLPLSKIKTTVLLSQLRQDATRSQDTTFSTFDEFVSSIRVSGLHRTTTEIASKNDISETNAGLIITTQSKNKMNIGASLLSTWYSLPIQKKPTLHNQFEFSGSHNWIGSVFFDASFWGLYFAGEVARSKSGGTGMMSALIMPLSSKVDISLSGRWYDKNFHSIYGQGFAENSRIINEKGSYVGLQFRPHYKHKISAFIDTFRFPWLTFQANAPSQGMETLLRYDWSILKTTRLSVQHRFEQKERNFTIEDQPLSKILTTYRHQFFLNLDYSLLSLVNGRNRIQWNNWSTPEGQENGWVILQDVTLKIKKWQVSGRYALFNSDSFDTRNYVFEQDLRYTFNVPAYSGSGTRWYAVVQKKISKKWTISGKYATFKYVDVNNTTHDIRFQVFYYPSQK